MDTPAIPLEESALPASPGTLLLVDDDANSLHALSRLVRDEPYRVLTAGSGAEALEILRRENVDVVICGQCTPGTHGVEFLRQAQRLRPDTVRMALSGSTELTTVTEAINEGAIYKFLTKPWDDHFLRASLLEAFARKALTDENRRLDHQLRLANEQLARYNEQLKASLEEQRRRLQLGEKVLRLAKEGLDQLPVPVIGIDHAGRLAFVNVAASAIAAPDFWPVGAVALEALPAAVGATLRSGYGSRRADGLFGRDWVVDVRALGPGHSRGALITLLPTDPASAVLPLDYVP